MWPQHDLKRLLPVVNQTCLTASCKQASVRNLFWLHHLLHELIETLDCHATFSMFCIRLQDGTHATKPFMDVLLRTSHKISKPLQFAKMLKNIFPPRTSHAEPCPNCLPCCKALTLTLTHACGRQKNVRASGVAKPSLRMEPQIFRSSWPSPPVQHSQIPSHSRSPHSYHRVGQTSHKHHLESS